MNTPKKHHLCFGTRLTAYEALDYLDDLNAFIAQMTPESLVCVDAGQIETIDTAGCQMIDLAITAAQHKKVQLEIHLSDAVRNALVNLGITLEEKAEGVDP